MPKPPWMRELTYWINNRDRRDRRITLAAIHESVGATDALSLAKFCARAGVSYHASADNEKIVYMVPRSWDAWHLRNGNPRADGLCLCTPVRGYSPAEWLGPQRRKLDIAAWWLSVICPDRGIDLARCNHQNIRDALRGGVAAGGAIEHHDYTLATHDGTHTDPRGWDARVWDYVLTTARSAPTPPAPKPAPRRSRLTEDSKMHVVTGPDETRWVSYFFEPGSLHKITLGWGTAGQLHDAKWWVRKHGWDKPRGVEEIPLTKWAHGGDQPHHMSLAWDVPDDADCLEIVVTAPGQGLHIVGTP